MEAILTIKFFVVLLDIVYNMSLNCFTAMLIMDVSRQNTLHYCILINIFVYTKLLPCIPYACMQVPSNGFQLFIKVIDDDCSRLVGILGINYCGG